MKAALALLPLLLTGATNEVATDKAAADEPVTVEPAMPGLDRPDFTIPNRGLIEEERCDDYIRQVRRDRGLPELRREPAEPGDATLWSAVDRRIDGCPVLVRHGEPDDVRPFPKPAEGPLFRRIPVGD